MELFQILIMFFGLFALSRVYLQRKSRNFSFNEFVFWSGIWTFLIVISFMQPLLQIIADFIGISRGVDLLIYGGITVLFYMVYKLYAKVDSQQQQITSLVSKIALNNSKRKKK